MVHHEVGAQNSDPGKFKKAEERDRWLLVNSAYLVAYLDEKIYTRAREAICLIYKGSSHLATVQKSLQRVALRLVFLQLIVTMTLAFIILLIAGWTKGFSTFLGGSAYILPNFLFAWLIFSRSKQRFSDQFLPKFMMGEFSKLILSAVFFVLLVKYLPVNVIFVLLGYAIAIFSFLFICGWHFTRGASSS